MLAHLPTTFVMIIPSLSGISVIFRADRDTELLIFD